LFVPSRGAEAWNKRFKGELRIAASCVAVVALIISVPAQAANELWEQYDRLVDSRKGIVTLGPDLFGDESSLYTGNLSFRHTDISIKGTPSCRCRLRVRIRWRQQQVSRCPHCG
jgi:hypothetical protein